MVRYRTGYRMTRSDDLYMIVEVRWDKINFLGPHRKVLVAKCLKTANFVELSLPHSEPDISVNSWEVASPAIPEAPSEWFAAEHVKEELHGVSMEQAAEMLSFSDICE